VTKHAGSNHSNLGIATQLSRDSRRLCDSSELLMREIEILWQRFQRVKPALKSAHDTSVKMDPYFGITEPPDADRRISSERLCDSSELLMREIEILWQRFQDVKPAPKSAHDTSAKTGPYFGITEPPDADRRISSETNYRAMTSADEFLTLTSRA